jgi:hypothetical protein
LDGCELSEKERHTLRGMMFMAPEDMRRELSFNPFNSPISTINHSNNEPTTSTPSEIGPKDDVDVLLKYNNPLDREALDEFSFTTNVVVTTSLYHDSFTSYCHTIRERNRLNRYKNEKKLIMFQTKSEEVEVNTITIDLDDVVVNWSEMLDYLLQSTPEYVIPRTDSPVNIQSSYIGSLSFDVQLEPSASSLAPSQVNDGIIQPVYTKWSAEGVEENQIPKTHSISSSEPSTRLTSMDLPIDKRMNMLRLGGNAVYQVGTDSGPSSSSASSHTPSPYGSYMDSNPITSSLWEKHLSLSKTNENNELPDAEASRNSSRSPSRVYSTDVASSSLLKYNLADKEEREGSFHSSGYSLTHLTTYSLTHLTTYSLTQTGLLPQRYVYRS